MPDPPKPSDKIHAEREAVSTTMVFLIVGVLGIAAIIGAVVISVFAPAQLATSATIFTFALAIIVPLIAVINKVDKLAVHVNSRLTELVASTKLASHAQGVTDERAGIQMPTTKEIEAAKTTEKVIDAVLGEGVTVDKINVKAAEVHVSKEPPQPDGS